MNKSFFLAIVSVIATVISFSAAYAQEITTKAAEGESWRSEKNCGVNCAYMLLEFFGKNDLYEELCKEANINEHGTSLLDIYGIVARRGVAVEMRKISPQELSIDLCPFIAHLELANTGDVHKPPVGHYVLVVQASADSGTIVIIDGTSGVLQEIGKDGFVQQWTGATLVCRPTGSWQMVLYLMLACAVSVLVLRRNFIPEFMWTMFRSKALASVIPLGFFLITPCVLLGEDSRLKETAIQEIESRWRSIESLEVSYRFSPISSEDTTSQIEKLGKAELKQGTETYRMWGERRWLERESKILATAPSIQVWAEDGNPMDKKDRNVRKEYRAFDGKVFRNQSKVTGLVLPAARLQKNNFQTMILVNIGYLPQSVCATTELNAMNYKMGLPSALKDKSYKGSVVELEGESTLFFEGTINNSPTNVLADKIWINPKTFSLLKREFYDKDNRLSIRFKNQDFKEVWPNVWLPRESDCEEYIAENAQKPVVTNRCIVSHWKLNHLKEEDFQLDFRPGTQVADFVLGQGDDALAYTIPVRPGDLKATVEIAMKSRQNRGSRFPFLIGCLFLIASVATSVFLYAKRKR